MSSASESNKLKRRRTDSNQEEVVVKQSPTLWLEDGNIILHAENTQFRVHRSVLSIHSTVFQDMFGIPQPQGEPTIDGCPVVHLSDSAQDVKLLLDALYKRRVPKVFLPPMAVL